MGLASGRRNESSCSLAGREPVSIKKIRMFHLPLCTFIDNRCRLSFLHGRESRRESRRISRLEIQNGRRAHFGGGIDFRSGRLASVGGDKLAAQ